MKQIRLTFIISFILIVLGILIMVQSNYVKSADKAEVIVHSIDANELTSTIARAHPAFLEGQAGTFQTDLMAAETDGRSPVMTPITGSVLRGNPRQTALTGELAAKTQPEGESMVAAGGGGENPVINQSSKKNEAGDTTIDVLPTVNHYAVEFIEERSAPPITLEPIRLTAPSEEIEASNWLAYGDENGEREDPVPFIWPAVEKWLSGYNFSYYHPGIDIAAIRDDLVFAAASGKVIEVQHSNYGYGNMVIIDHLNGYQTLYAHMSLILAKEGDFVIQGQPIGLAGSTGNSTGTHLHFEIHNQGRFVNPWLFLTR